VLSVYIFNIWRVFSAHFKPEVQSEDCAVHAEGMVRLAIPAFNFLCRVLGSYSGTYEYCYIPGFNAV
jgi:hypothetical protein